MVILVIRLQIHFPSHHLLWVIAHITVCTITYHRVWNMVIVVATALCVASFVKIAALWLCRICINRFWLVGGKGNLLIKFPCLHFSTSSTWAAGKIHIVTKATLCSSDTVFLTVVFWCLPHYVNRSCFFGFAQQWTQLSCDWIKVLKALIYISCSKFAWLFLCEEITFEVWLRYHWSSPQMGSIMFLVMLVQWSVLPPMTSQGFKLPGDIHQWSWRSIVL